MEITQHTERRKSAVQQPNESSLMQLDAQPGRTALVNGKEYLFFSGYAYLGMNGNDDFKKLVSEGTDKYGWSFPSSRISNTGLKLFDAFEEKLSQFTSFKHTVAAPNGYTAGRMAVSLFSHKAKFLVAPNAHAAVSDGLPKYQGSYDNWTASVIDTLNNHDGLQQVVIIADSLNPLSATLNDLSFLQYIEKKCVCIIDDSHGMGLLGEKGNGTIARLPANENIDYLLVYSLSKAFNLNGGAISTNNSQFEKKLRALPFYTAGTAMHPGLMHAFLHADDLYDRQRDKLRKNISLFAAAIKNNTIIKHVTPELPIFRFQQPIDDADLAQKGMIISSFAYPDPNGAKIQRIVLNALHTEDDLRTAAALLIR